MKDIIITAGGKNITPSEIENQLKFSPYISDAVVVGDRRPYLTCLVMIDQENVEKFAQDRAVPFTNYASLCRAQEVQDLIWGEIEKVNADFARVETIKRFYLIEQQLTPEDDELTPTMKLKRKFVNEKYQEEIEVMYRSASAASISPITAATGPIIPASRQLAISPGSGASSNRHRRHAVRPGITVIACPLNPSTPA